MIRRLTPGWRIRATLTALVLPPLVYLVPLDRIARWISRSRIPLTPDDAVDDRALAEWADRVLDRLPPPWHHTCLKRAVVLHYLLHRAGRPAELRIGVRRGTNATLAAHAWLVRDDAPYLEVGANQIGSYQLLAAFPAASARKSPP